MANQKHVDWLNQGPVAWNEWRRKNPDIKPDLSGTNLRSVHFSDVHLPSGASLGDDAR